MNASTRPPSPDAREEIVEDVRTFGVGMLAFVIFVPVGIAILVGSFLVLGGAYIVLGWSIDTLSVATALVWFAGTLVVMFLVFRALYRRLMRVIPAYAPDPPAPSTSGRLDGDGEPPFDGAPTLSLAELDARFAATPEQIDDR